VFLQITGAVEEDLAVPDRPFTFGEPAARAGGRRRRRCSPSGPPVLRLHLTDLDARSTACSARTLRRADAPDPDTASAARMSEP
jgi:hypothetical protein